MRSGVEVCVGGGEVGLMALFGWYLYFGGSSQKYTVGKWGEYAARMFQGVVYWMYWVLQAVRNWLVDASTVWFGKE